MTGRSTCTAPVRADAGRGVASPLLPTAARLGSRVAGRREYSVCIADPSGLTFDDTFSAPRLFVSDVMLPMLPGYPLEPMRVDGQSGRHISTLPKEGTVAFWRRIIGEPLCAFVQRAMNALPEEGSR